MIILSQERIREYLRTLGPGSEVALSFISVDEGDAFVSSDLGTAGGSKGKAIMGLLTFGSEEQDAQIVELPAHADVFVVAHKRHQDAAAQAQAVEDFTYRGWVRNKDHAEERPVELVPIREDLFSRVRGLYETDVLQAKTVLIIGLGSGGGTIAIEMAKAGVGHFILVDHDRLEVVNVVRHVCGLSDLGRFKTKAVRDLILDKNPFAEIETHEIKCDTAWLPTLQELASRADLVFCCTDNRPSRTLINRACLAAKRVCIYGGTFTRAYGGHVLRVIPDQTMCYQCFIDMLPEVAEDQEIASQQQADNLAYADRPVAIEPGLATDIAPIAIMCVKLGILELLRGQPTTLANLYDDLANPWFQWLNRREVDTEYADLSPLDSGEDELRILAWYGIPYERNTACPACGDFIASRLGGGTPLAEEEINQFASNPDGPDEELVNLPASSGQETG